MMILLHCPRIKHGALVEMLADDFPLRAYEQAYGLKRRDGELLGIRYDKRGYALLSYDVNYDLDIRDYPVKPFIVIDIKSKGDYTDASAVADRSSDYWKTQLIFTELTDLITEAGLTTSRYTTYRNKALFIHRGIARRWIRFTSIESDYMHMAPAIGKSLKKTVDAYGYFKQTLKVFKGVK